MSKPIRILHIFGVLDKGGAEGYIMDIYRLIDRSRVQFDFIVHTQGEGFHEREIKRLGGIVYHGAIRYRVVNLWSSYKGWKNFFTEHPYHCIHIHTFNMAVPILMAAKKMGIQYRICHSHATNEYNFLRKLHVCLSRRWLRKLATTRLAISDMAGRFVFGFNYETKTNAVNAELFRYRHEKRQMMRQSLDVEDKFIIGLVGRFHVQKNHSFLLDIFSESAKILPNAILILAGDGELRPQLEEKITALGILDKVILLGIRNDIPDLLQAFDIFTMPSLFEGLPGAALEAQASGLPCLLSDTITTEAKIIDDLVTYLPIDKGVDLWVKQITRIAEKHPVRRDTFDEVKAAGCDITEISKWFENLYINLLTKST